MINSIDLSRAGCKYIGTPYSQIDCQKLWEKMIADCGYAMDLGGSNSWFREMMQDGWTGTPEECIVRFGEIPVGATLYIWEEVDEGTPEKFRHDGIGDLTHMGVYTGMDGNEMCRIAAESGVSDPYQYNFGNGAIHSSSSKKHVCTSNFAGKTIRNGGWNRIGLWKKVFYNERINAMLNGGSVPDGGGEPDSGGETEPMTATVQAPNGGTVFLRTKPNQNAKWTERVPSGDFVDVLNWGDDWSQVSWHGKKGYMMSQFLIRGEVTPGEDDPVDPIDPDEPTGEYVTIQIPIRQAETVRVALEEIVRQLEKVTGKG